ncbi:MAG: hypothetical protein KJ601_01710, partial [Nanoarchaeota archaeon]|nr:hypothetical protein [Nanoarchaeota archaeon]MBU1705023.1 hypothetical protein [Nanoarchaeota archaeon]
PAKGSKEEPEPTPTATEDISELNRRMRLIEERNSSIDVRMEVVEENAVKRHQSLSKEFKTFLLDISEQKREINELKNKILEIIRNITLLARKEEVEVLRKYLDIWKPMNFVTRNEIEEIVKDTIRNQKV